MMEIPQRRRSVNDYTSREALEAALLQSNRDRNSSDDLSTANSVGVVTLDGHEVDDKRDWIQNIVDPETQPPQSLSHEVERLLVLKSYMILDTHSSTEDSNPGPLDRLTEMTTRVFGVPVCMVSLVDLGRLYVLAKSGMDVREAPRKGGFCAHTVISTNDFTVICDATKDARFEEHPFVKGPAHIRFYAAAPLVSPEGYRIGAFCLVDTKPWPQGLTQSQKDTLRDMSNLAMDAIVKHQTIKEQQSQLQFSSQMLASAAHDLLTPLTGLQLSLSLLVGDADFNRKMRAEQKEILMTASSCTEIMGEICGSLRVRNGGSQSRSQEPPQETMVSPGSASRASRPAESVIEIKTLVHRLHQVMGAVPKQVPVSVVAAAELPSFVVGDEVSIFRAMLNLLTNSCERTSSGFIRMNIRVTETEGLQSQLVFDCEDSGPSIDSEEQRKLAVNTAGIASGIPWEEFTISSGSSTSAKWSVSSMSSLVSHIHSLGGTFGVSSGDNPQLSTTRFFFCVPLFVPEVAPQSSLKRDRSGHRLRKCASVGKIDLNLSSLQTKKARTKNALIIDDSIIVRKTLARALSKLGYETSQAVNGMEGLKYMQYSSYDLVLCDFLMPVMDGLDCVREYRRWERVNRPGFNQYIAGISAHASGKDSERGISIGMNTYMPKPVTLKDLVDVQSGADFIVASEMLDKIESQRDEGTSTKRVKTISRKLTPYDDQKVCLLVTDESNSSRLAGIVVSKGWKSVAASDADALSLLKSRNWDAVVLDGGLSAVSCVRQFRDWEQQNRIHRQRNIYLMSTGFNSLLQNWHSVALVQLPPGFDGVVGKPAKTDEVEKLLRKAEEPCTFEAEDIIITS
jgi:CheY-like chemotaxis protein